ncbi:MAG TPA: hypothetical protein PLC34_10170 [Burkholderiaceae bacterium]|nr:hypothetical protein [Burkholderiaceae bacterium]
MSTPPRNVPRFLPTLTQVVRPPETAQESRLSPLDTEQMIHRVLQRVDLALEPMLREVIGPLVLDQITAMATRLRPEVEAVVRQAVADALAHEFDIEKRPCD